MMLITIAITTIADEPHTAATIVGVKSAEISS